MAIYDAIGQSYAQVRVPDACIVDSLLDLLGLKAGIIADLGAGPGGYSRALAERGFFIHAVEPSAVMRAQASEHPRVQWLNGWAENIPLPDSSVDGAISVLAVHHFSDLAKAIQEMQRVAGTGPIVLLTFDPRLGEKLWLADYFPSIWQDAFHAFPPLSSVAELIQTHSQRTVEISPFMLPHDLSDLFMAAGWRRPELYLDANVRAGISAFALAEPAVVEAGLKQLRDDLATGSWDSKYGELRKVEAIDAGYRFLCARAVG